MSGNIDSYLERLTSVAELYIKNKEEFEQSIEQKVEQSKDLSNNLLECLLSEMSTMQRLYDQYTRRIKHDISHMQTHIDSMRKKVLDEENTGAQDLRMLADELNELTNTFKAYSKERKELQDKIYDMRSEAIDMCLNNRQYKGEEDIRNMLDLIENLTGLHVSRTLGNIVEGTIGDYTFEVDLTDPKSRDEIWSLLVKRSFQ
ncbi:hypothetical protein PCE1_000829 [Barthelona sp. PCE]